VLILGFIAAVAGGLCAFAQDGAPVPASPEDTVSAHFAAIQAEEYTQADAYFTEAFRSAFKGDLAAMDNYYLTRRVQLSSGYSIGEVLPLADEDKETARVTVEFHDPDPDAVISIAERMYYYLIREKVEDSAPLRGSDGRAWRIDIFDALSFDSLADARRRPYLYTREVWPEDASRDLRSRQGLFRIQQALSGYYREHGEYPFRLRGGDNRRDELISGGYLRERYPGNGYNGSPIKFEEFGKKSSGDISYYSVDADGDGLREGYWLLLHGKTADEFYFQGKDTVYILGTAPATMQLQMAEAFSVFWLARAGEHLELNHDVPILAAMVETESWIEPLVSPHEAELEAAGLTLPVAPESVEQLDPMDITPASVDSAGEDVDSVVMAPVDEADIPTVAEMLAVARTRVDTQSLLRTVDEVHSALDAGIAEVEQPAEDTVEVPVPEEAPPSEDATPPVEPAEQLTVYGYGW